MRCVPHNFFVRRLIKSPFCLYAPPIFFFDGLLTARLCSLCFLYGPCRNREAYEITLNEPQNHGVVISRSRFGTKNDCAGEGQQQLTTHIRTHCSVCVLS
jgi:hypothetical protein